MTIKIYQRVRLITDRFASTDNVTKQAIGYVIELYTDGNCEVEFSDENGITYAQVVTKPNEIQVAEEDN
ncbi:MAG: DUF4926 domain-containing protein [Planctomycetaceae bacterium]|jgi:hypothetical protein|nr:DUF4926 domain-containing protein [Planctomycetaceae bacterium]